MKLSVLLDISGMLGSTVTVNLTFVNMSLLTSRSGAWEALEH